MTEKEESRELLLNNSEYKLKETLSYLGCLRSEDSIRQATYDYLYENVLFVLNEVIQEELFKDVER